MVVCRYSLYESSGEYRHLYRDSYEYRYDLYERSDEFRRRDYLSSFLDIESIYLSYYIYMSL